MLQVRAREGREARRMRGAASYGLPCLVRCLVAVRLCTSTEHGRALVGVRGMEQGRAGQHSSCGLHRSNQVWKDVCYNANDVLHFPALAKVALRGPNPSIGTIVGASRQGIDAHRCNVSHVQWRSNGECVFAPLLPGRALALPCSPTRGSLSPSPSTTSHQPLWVPSLHSMSEQSACTPLSST